MVVKKMRSASMMTWACNVVLLHIILITIAKEMSFSGASAFLFHANKIHHPLLLQNHHRLRVPNIDTNMNTSPNMHTHTNSRTTESTDRGRGRSRKSSVALSMDFGKFFNDAFSFNFGDNGDGDGEKGNKKNNNNNKKNVSFGSAAMNMGMGMGMGTNATTSGMSLSSTSTSMGILGEDYTTEDEDEYGYLGCSNIFKIKVKSLKVGGCRLYLSLFLIGEVNNPTRGTWRMDQNGDGGIDLYYQDTTGALMLLFEEDQIVVNRMGSAPSMNYLVSESALLNGMLDQLDDIAFDVSIKEENRLICLYEPGDAIDVVRGLLSFN